MHNQLSVSERKREAISQQAHGWIKIQTQHHFTILRASVQEYKTFSCFKFTSVSVYLTSVVFPLSSVYVLPVSMDEQSLLVDHTNTCNQ